MEPDLPRARVRPLPVRLALPRLREPGEAVWGLAVCRVSGEGRVAFSRGGGASRAAEKEARGRRGGGCEDCGGKLRHSLRFDGVQFGGEGPGGGTTVQYIRRAAECRLGDGWVYVQGVGEGTE